MIQTFKIIHNVKNIAINNSNNNNNDDNNNNNHHHHQLTLFNDGNT